MSRYTLPFLGTTRPNPGTNEPFSTALENATFDQIDLKLSDQSARTTSVENRATSLENATNGKLRKIANSDAQRTTAFPSPVHGDRIERTDKQYDERYYGAYHATTNKHGVAVAGWFPDPNSKGPSCHVQKAAAQTTVANVDLTLTWTAPSAATETYDPYGFWVTGNPSRLTAPVKGVYRFRGKVRTSGTTTVDALLLRNGVAYEPVHASATGELGASSSPYLEGDVWLDANQYVELKIRSTGGTYVVRVDNESTWASLEYVRPF